MAKGKADPVEIELKLDFEPADRTRLRAALAALQARGSTRHLVSTYFDTPERDIAKAGYVLRVRRDGRRRVQTVKAVASAAAGLFERAEWEHPLRGGRPCFDDRSGPLAHAVGAHALGRLEPLFLTDVHRTVFRIDAASAAIELALDEGECRADVRVAPICELELELRSGTPRALFDLARRLNEAVPLRLGVRSKSERGGALLLGASPSAWKAEPIALDCDHDAADAFRTIAQACIRQFRLNETLLLHSGEAEALHQARVGLRRLRTAFSLFGPFFADDPQAALLREELRWLAAELGGVRNIDVLIPRFEGETRAALTAARDDAFEHVRIALAGARTRLLMIDLVEWLALGTWRSEPAHPGRLEQDGIAFASDVLEARRDRLAHRGEGLAGLGPKRRHQVRIEAKKLRYAAEFFASLYGGDKARRRHARFLGSIEALQDQLGELNDLAIGPALLEGLGIDAELPKSGKRCRRHILDRAEQAYRALLHAKRFW